ncbi:predicted protein [Phaeodactylum tricornutum CCAP 1055/1]|uniref:Fe2OG dioxygenase domain-containing protein n=1 Tax=Phaeodactylum tricornutum (strain CCAP 1055/1) TaxID=556484 RepID=B7G4U1_PHATC|nr:predicted protein [Phaeodactylum tricornutum CCAP 1055/1]EEC46672.1 predicted protein [Phaeodactylum tricornutum CCAP 1055/1]|eukprot:XP_002182132.1 predicted protein [Phaeodactylum tricornutum CCAP 1055/1]
MCQHTLTLRAQKVPPSICFPWRTVSQTMHQSIPSLRSTVVCLLMLITGSLQQCLPLCVQASSAASTNTGRSTRQSTPSRPPFLAHVTDNTLDRARRVALQRHEKAVAQALENYPTNQQPPDSLNADATTATATGLDSYVIDAAGSVPDFADQLQRVVHVTTPPLLSRDECRNVIDMAESHFQQNNIPWSMQTSGQYKVAGFWIKNIPAVHAWFTHLVQTRLFPLLARTYPDFVVSPHDLCVDNAYLFKYDPETGRRTDIHTDSGCLSFTIALSGTDDYTGGGTWFEGLQPLQGLQGNEHAQQDAPSWNHVLSMEAGQVTIRPGGVKHCGHAVNTGIRYIIGGFCMHQNKPEIVRQLLTPPPITDSSEDDTNSVDILEAAVVLNPKCDASYGLLADRYKQNGLIEKAKQVLEYCVQHVHPTSGEVNFSLGSIYMAEQDYVKAKACFETCLAVDDCDVEALMGLAHTASQVGDTTTEEVYYQRVVATPGASDTIRASAFCNLGVLHENNDIELHYYKQSIALAPTKFAPRYSLGCAYASRESWKAAIRVFREAMTIVPNEEGQRQTLQNMYTAAMHVVQTEAADSPGRSQQEVLERFRNLMGKENFEILASSAKQ